jgi:hypothetical protein
MNGVPRMKLCDSVNHLASASGKVLAISGPLIVGRCRARSCLTFDENRECGNFVLRGDKQQLIRNWVRCLHVLCNVISIRGNDVGLPCIEDDKWQCMNRGSGSLHDNKLGIVFFCNRCKLGHFIPARLESHLLRLRMALKKISDPALKSFGYEAYLTLAGNCEKVLPGRLVGTS